MIGRVRNMPIMQDLLSRTCHTDFDTASVIIAQQEPCLWVHALYLLLTKAFCLSIAVSCDFCAGLLPELLGLELLGGVLGAYADAHQPQRAD